MDGKDLPQTLHIMSLFPADQIPLKPPPITHRELVMEEDGTKSR